MLFAIKFKTKKRFPLSRLASLSRAGYHLSDFQVEEIIHTGRLKDNARISAGTCIGYRYNLFVSRY